MNKIYFSLLFILLLSCADKDDAVKSYWDNGNLKSELRYKEGKLDGLCRWYYNNGKPEMEVIYNMNVLEGPGKRWHENGNIESVFYYKIMSLTVLLNGIMFQVSLLKERIMSMVS